LCSGHNPLSEGRWTRWRAGFDIPGARFALDAGPDGAHCLPSTASADLTLDAGTLGSMYLGGYGVRTLAAAGLLDEHSSNAVARADAMFRSPVVPGGQGRDRGQCTVKLGGGHEVMR
jgi:hypothetical protein